MMPCVGMAPQNEGHVDQPAADVGERRILADGLFKRIEGFPCPTRIGLQKSELG